MFIDARSVSTGTIIETEVCIVGAGAAGITLAREFSDQSFRVVLLESGGTEPDAATQDLYSGNNIGRPYFDPRVQRLRYFGGTTNHWAGRCALPDPVDFEVREGMPTLVGRSRWIILYRGISAPRPSVSWVRTVIYHQIGASQQVTFRNRSKDRILFVKLCK